MLTVSDVTINGKDYKRESFSVKKDSKLKIHLAPGGGFALQIK